MNKVVVLGGSFNPPTIAHEKILVQAVKNIDANLGLFVPSSHNYVAKKMRKQNKENQVLPEKVRMDMLEKMASTYDNLGVDDCELGDDGRGHTYDTLVKIQNKYKDSQIYFIIGYDTIRMIPRWHSKDDLVRKFKFVVFSRNNMDVQQELQKYSLLVEHKDNFIQVDSPSGIEDISSTLVRQNLQKGNAQIEHLVSKSAIDILIANKNYLV